MSEKNENTASTILCIDDESIGLQLRKAVLEQAGYRVLTALDGFSGLILFRTETIDGVVLDYCMPEMNGEEVARTMRRERPEIPILLLSALVNLPPEVIQLADLRAIKGEGPRELLDNVSFLVSLRRGHRTRQDCVEEAQPASLR